MRLRNGSHLHVQRKMNVTMQEENAFHYIVKALDYCVSCANRMTADGKVNSLTRFHTPRTKMAEKI